MAKKTTVSAEVAENTIPAAVGTKLRRLVIQNLGCIGNDPVSIDLDDVVVLVGQNNTGKSTILRAYEVISNSSTPKLTLEDFPGNNVTSEAPPIIELHTRILENPPASKWIAMIDGEPIVRERWTFLQPNVAATRQGFDVESGQWSANVPWGAANVANSRRPKPHRIEAFGTPERQVATVVELLLTALKDAIKAMPPTQVGEDGVEAQTEYGKLLESCAALQKSVVESAQERITTAQNHLTDLIQNVFRGYRVEFDAKAEEDLASCLNFFKPGAVLRMGPAGGHMSAAEKQGSGARRTLMWAALKYAAESDLKEGMDRPNLLLLDEPELCLHPNAVREACKVLYDLPETGRWQVMVTTHSPAFIDLSRDNTTVVRVHRGPDGKTIQGTTVFRPEKAQLSEDEKEELKMLNLCDPHLCEFFFGGRTVVVEGDTEYTAFKYLIHKYFDDEKLRDVHVVRARGKATICLVAKILNQFKARYAVLHDCDSPTTTTKTNKVMVNPAWTNNLKIRDAVKEAIEAVRVRLIALIPHFEGAFFGEELSDNKPVHAWITLREREDVCEKVKALLYALLDHNAEVPSECAEWSDGAVLEARWKQFSKVV